MIALSPRERRAYEANVWKSYLYQFLLSFQLWWPIWVIYLQDTRNFSLTQIASLESLFWIVVVVSEVPTGAVADRYGRKRSLLLASLFNTLAILVFGLASNYLLVMASYLAWGLGITFQSGADSALLFDSLKMLGREEEFQKVSGRSWAVASFGILAGGLLGAPLAAATNLSFPILVSAGLAFLSLPVGLSLREPTLAESEGRLPYATLIRQSVRTASGLPPVRYMLLLAAVVSVGSWAPMIFVQPFLVGHGVAVGDLGLLQTPNRVLGMAGALGAYRVAARLGMRGSFLAIPVSLVAFYAVLGAWDSVYAYAAFPLAAFVSSFSFPVVTDYLNRRIPSNQRATILSLRQLTSSLALAAAQPLLGFVADQASLTAMFWTVVALTAAAAPPALVLWLRADAREVEGEVSEAPAVP